MVGFPSELAKTVEEGRIEEVDQDPKVKSSRDPLDFSFTDSFLDFDTVNWLGSNQELDEFKLEDKDFDFFEDVMEIVQEEVRKETSFENQTTIVSGIKSEHLDDTSARIEASSQSVISGTSRATEDGPEPSVSSEIEIIESVPVALPTMNVDEEELKKTEDGLACSIEVGLEKVSLAVDDDQKNDEANGEANASESESEASSSSDSSSSSSEEESDEEEEKNEDPEAQIISRKEVDVAGELEEGEIKSVDGEEADGGIDDDDDEDKGEHDDADVMIAWSDDEDEEILGTQAKEPLRSKNELKELPPVPAVNVTLEPHHATLPVGVVLSVLGTQVIVEGVEKHNPLCEGSILWITEKRAPLGLVDEIFGPVKNPYYIVRFNSESEVPEGINQGTPVSFVSEFANHVLNDKNLYKKGYDASGENDEEISEEVEFSDDEKEAEYRRMQKMSKRGMNQQKPVNTKNNKKKKNKDQGRHMNRSSPQQTENQTAHQTFLPNMMSFNHSGSPMSSMAAPTGVGMGSLGPPHLQSQPQMGGFGANNLANRTMAPTGFPSKGAEWNSQAHQQNQYQLPLPNQMAMPNVVPMHQIPLMQMQNQNPTSNQMIFQQQFPNLVAQGGQGGLNFFAGPGSGPWPGIAGQNLFNQAFGIDLNSQAGGFQGMFQNVAQAQTLVNPFASQGFQQQQPQQHQHRHQLQQPYSQGFHGGPSAVRGRKPPHRGGGRFGRGRGRHQSG